MKHICFLLLITIALFSCNKPQHEAIIPANAAVVAVLNTPGIIKKVTLSSIANLSIAENLELFKDSSNAATSAGRLLQHAEEAGIDNKDMAYGWISFIGTTPVFHACFAMQNTSKLESYLTDSLHAKINQSDAFQTAALDQQTLLAFNKNAAVLVFATGTLTTDSLSTSIKQFAAIEKPASGLTDNDEFKKIIESEHDVTVWIRSEHLKTAIPTYLSTLAYVDGKLYLDFNDGEFALSFEEAIKDSSLQSYSGAMKNKTDLSDFSSIDNKRLLGAVAGGVNLDKILSRHKDSINASLAHFKITTEDLLNTFSGDFLAAVQGIRVSQRLGTTYDFDDNFNPIIKIDTIEETHPLATVILTIKNPENAQTLLNKLAPHLNLKLENNHYLANIMGIETAHIYIRGKQLIITNDELVWGGKPMGNPLQPALTTLFQEPMSIYLNYQALAKTELGENNLLKNTPHSAFMRKLDFFSLTAKESTANQYVFNIKVTLLNKEENALIQFLKFRKEEQKKSAAPQKVNA